MLNDDFLEPKLAQRRSDGSFRELKIRHDCTDFSSNDYLGIARIVLPGDGLAHFANGSTGSRLLTGNSALALMVEDQIAAFHKGKAAILYNSGYDANIGLLSCVPQKGDTIIYDFLSHASIRDGIRLSAAQSYSFRHNDLNDLESRLKTATGTVFVVTESVFSMDGDLAPLREMSKLCERQNANLIVDEAHATGVLGPRGAGLVQEYELEQHCFARIYTFGKALGCHGAVVVGSERLKDFLVNFSRAFIYTTALPPAALIAIERSYELFPEMDGQREKLGHLIEKFQSAKLNFQKLETGTPIQGVIVPGNENAKQLSSVLLDKGLDVRPILYPTVPRGSERLRIVMHSFNTFSEVDILINGL
ncbi:aminotransferase class I/II-fold pyridoxal phosphate-dependent enzyme [Flavitalea sp.]|nr:8-amino-7-oxononanoate synthase [Flavitalea sp.]